MKRTAITATVLTMTMLFAACDNGDTSTRQQGTTLRARHADATRTQFDGAATTWSEGDAMTIFISDGTANDAYTFETHDPAGGIFHCDDVILDGQTQYLYHAVWPACTTDTSGEIKLNIGAAVQTQSGSSTAHIAALDPLTGQASGKPADTVIEMKHSAALLKLVIRNATGAAISGIRSVRITAPEGTTIAGEYQFDPATGTISGTADKVGNTIHLKTAESGQLADGGEFTAWAAATPFEITAGKTLTFTVTDDNGIVYRTDKTPDEALSFPAGRIMSTVLELSDATAMNEITVNVDFTDPEIYPEGFPTSEKDKISSGTYLLGDYIFTINCDTYYYKSNNYICFYGLTKSNKPATICIPQIKGYRPAAIAVSVHDSSNNQNTRLSVINEDGNIMENQSAKYPTSNPTAWTYTQTNNSTRYYIKIEGMVNAERQCHVTGISITYDKI